MSLENRVAEDSNEGKIATHPVAKIENKFEELHIGDDADFEDCEDEVTDFVLAEALEEERSCVSSTTAGGEN